jgi:hypothetical protein
MPRAKNAGSNSVGQIVVTNERHQNKTVDSIHVWRVNAPIGCFGFLVLPSENRQTGLDSGKWVGLQCISSRCALTKGLETDCRAV